MDWRESKNYKIIHTNLYGQVYEEILESVVGQMSDGIWENTPSYEKYWENVRIEMDTNTQEVIICTNKEMVFKHYGCRYPWGLNPFYGMSDSEVRRFFASKIKGICLIQQKDDGTKGQWHNGSTYECTYIGYGCHITFGDCQQAYEILKSVF